MSSVDLEIRSWNSSGAVLSFILLLCSVTRTTLALWFFCCENPVFVSDFDGLQILHKDFFLFNLFSLQQLQQVLWTQFRVLISRIGWRAQFKKDSPLTYRLALKGILIPSRNWSAAQVKGPSNWTKKWLPLAVEFSSRKLNFLKLLSVDWCHQTASRYLWWLILKGVRSFLTVTCLGTLYPFLLWLNNSFFSALGYYLFSRLFWFSFV